MASTMLTAEASAAALTEADVDKAGIHSCVNDPDFAIICDFLQKFSKDLGLDLPNFKLLLQWLTKTDDISTQLRDMQIKLLRKTRKTVHEKSWESALSKFCFTYSAQDGWEIERFGYKNSSVKVKLRILRELLECQFERNTKFRAKILTLSADSLRSKPIGRDRQGHAYWITQDNDCNIRIYQEHLDEDIWRVVATTREEFVNLIKRLRGSELVEPCKDICIVDEDTNSSSHVDSESIERVPPPEERDDSQEEEQKVPKLSIKLVHEKSLKEATNTKNLDKIKKELVAPKGVKLLNSSSYSKTIKNKEGHFGNDCGSEEDSLDDSSDDISFTKKNDTEQRSQRNLKSEDGSKKVKPLLISQNKVLNCSTSRNASKKRALDQVGSYSTTHSDHTINALKKSRTSLLDLKYEDKKQEGENYEEPAEETAELEELEEEDIDSAAAEEDENEEKLFSDYEDENDDIGEEISDPIMHVTGEGSGKDCDVENYLYCIDYDLDNYVQPILSDIIVEDFYYVLGEGNGRDCLVGNNKNDGNSVSTPLEISKSNIERELIPQSEISSPATHRNISSLLENTGFLESSTLNESATKDESLNLTDSKLKKIDENKVTKEVNEIEKQDIPKEEINQPNGGKISKIINLKNENLVDKLSDTDNTSENLSAYDMKKPKDFEVAEVTSNEGNQTGIDNRKNSTSVAVDVMTKQTLASKMSALESLKKELRESKQKLLEKRLPQAIETSNITIANQAIYNRKRRLTNQLQTAAVRSLNSESEVDLNSENNEDVVNDRALDIDATEEDVGGKRLKMRPKQANTELRKKIEAQKGAANDESTSSSGGEEELRKRKKIISKPTLSPPLLKPVEKLLNLEARRDCDVKGDEQLKEIEEKTTSATLAQVLIPLKKTTPTTPFKVKPTLAEIIEKKLKKAPENDHTGLNSTDSNNDVVKAATDEKLYVSPKQISKTLKKSLTTQIKLEESDEDSVSRKLTNSQELNSVVLGEKKTNEIQKITPERQRKRRSSEETVQHNSPEEPEAKKEVTAITENVTLKQVIQTEATKEETARPKPLKFNIQKEQSSPVSSRRSVRRSGVVPNYVDTLQSKRNRGSTKSSTKEFTGCENGGSVNEEEKHDLNTVKKDIADKSKGVNLPGKKASPSPTKNFMREVKSNKITNSKEVITKNDVSKAKLNSATKTTVKTIRKQREVDALNIIDVDSETPVRQSRRIAQQKIREEAERRKLEEIALRTMKQELKKKKKAEKQTDLTIVPPTEPSSESEESDVEIKKKVQKKKCPGKNGNWSSGSEEQEEPEEEDEEPIHYETDPGSPLFKSDHEFSPESDIEDESQVVPMKRARTVRKEDAVEGVSAPDEEEEACQKCNKSDHPEWILLCDNCDKGYHCSCLSPVLFYIPEGDWFCPPCQQEQLIKALESQLKEFDDLVENKRKKEEQEKRMVEEEKARLEREINEQKDKKVKRMDVKRNNEYSSAEDHSQEDDNDEAITSSDESILKGSKRESGQIKNRERLRNKKKSDKRNHRVGRHNVIRSRRNRLQRHESYSGSESEDSSKSESNSKSGSSSSSTYSESDNEPIYKLRKRRQINVSYRLNEYDDLINSALKKEMDEAAGAGNLGRGKDISTIIEADKEEKARQKQIEEIIVKPSNENNERVKETNQNSLKYELAETENDEKKEVMKQKENKNATESIIRKLNIKPSQKKKSRKLTTLDISSEGDDWSDEDFKGSSFDDEEEEDSSISCSNSDSSLEIYKRHGKLKKKRRKAARRAYRERRRDRRFLVDESDDEDVQLPKSKKKRKDDSDYTESEVDDDDVSELSENIDSADLCDDTTTDESDGAWRPNKRKKAKKSTASYVQKTSKPKSTHTKQSKKVEYSDDDVSESEDEDDYSDEVGSGKGMGKQPRSQPIKTSCNVVKVKGKGKEKPPAKTKNNNSSEVGSSQSDSEDSTRRTRGRRYAYIEDFEDDSSDGGIKPGVQRPDTPPEEREKFIKRQEEIKRMLAEKNAEGAKLVATPRLTPIKTDGENDKKSPSKPGGDSLSTVPLSVIRQAKVLDIDYLQRRGENLEDLSNEVGEVGDDFDDADLPDDLPEDMDEDAIARMVEEEEDFGVASTKELPAPDEVLRTQTLIKAAKNKEVEKPVSPSSLPMNSQQVTSVTLPPQTSGLQEPTRKRLPMPTMHPPLLRHQQFLMQDSMPGTQQLIQRHSCAPTSHLLQNALSAPLTQSLGKNYSSTTPAPQHSSINRLTHNIPLQPTVSHALSAIRPSQSTPPSIGIKTSPLLDHLTQDKATNQQTIAENKPRGRRKKITPLRDTLQKQQTAAAVTAATATSSALASSLVQNNEPVCTSSFLSSVIKSGTTQKLPIQTSVITSMTQTANSATIRSGVPMPPYVRTDGPKMFDALGNRIPQSTHQRHREPPQMPPTLLPPHPANRSSYGPPPPLKGSISAPPMPSSSNTPGSIRNPIRHVPPPYLGMPPNARHATHLNMYRPPMYVNPNFGPRVNVRPPNIHPPGYSTGSRAYPPYGYYPPPPPLTTPGQRSGVGSVPRPSAHLSQVQPTLAHPLASVIVSANSSKSSNAPTVTPQPIPLTTETTEPSPSSKSDIVTQESPIKIVPQTSSSPIPVIMQTRKEVNITLNATEPRKKLMTLQAYTSSTSKKSPVLPASDSSGSQSPSNPSAEINDDTSAPVASQNTSTDEPKMQEAHTSEFSGLVSYFSSQHDDYNT